MTVAVTARTLRLQRDLNAELRKITDAQTRDLVSAWVDAWDEVQPDLVATLLEMLTDGDKVTRSQLLRSERLRKVLAIIRQQLVDLAAETRITIIGDLQGVIDAAGGAQASVIDSQLPPGSGLLDDLDTWSRVDTRQIAAMVRRSTEQITALTRPLAPAAYDAVRRELLRGMAAGSNPRAVAGRIVKRAERRFNGGLNRALVISRSEILDAHRAAAALGQAQHADVLAGWTWLAALDRRTCPSCLAQHGSVHKASELGPFDHQQGRCARMATTKSWADLGLSVVEPPSLLPDAGDWFEKLPSEQQLEILGPSRWTAWQRGDFPMSDWSVRRSNPGWRDSYAVAPAPTTPRRAAA